MSVAVISSVYGGYDSPPEPPEQTLDAEWIYVTDDGASAPPAWNIVREPRPHLHPRMAAKIAKCRPDLYTNADVTVWVDGSFRFLTEHSLEDIVREARGPISQINHPWRQCIFEEAKASIGLPKYEGQPCDAQVQHYNKQGHPAGWGLWATGLIVMDHTLMPGTLAEIGTEWLSEQARFTYQDQLSEAVVLRRWGIRPHILPWPLHGSGIFEWHQHASEA